MKYSTAIAALQGVWDVMYLAKREASARFMVSEGGVNIGHGKVAIGGIPVAVN